MSLAKRNKTKFLELSVQGSWDLPLPWRQLTLNAHLSFHKLIYSRNWNLWLVGRGGQGERCYESTHGPVKSHYHCWENSGKGLPTVLGTIRIVRSGSGRKRTWAVLPWLCASHRGLQRKWEFQIPRSCNTWLLQDNCFPSAQLYQIAAGYAISWPAFWFMESITQTFNVPSESPMLNWLLSRFSTNETIYVQKESCRVWWQRPVILALGKWRRKIMSSSLPWTLTPVRVRGSVSKWKKKDNAKIIPKGCYLLTFLDLGPHKQKAPGTRLYNNAGSFPLCLWYANGLPHGYLVADKTGFRSLSSTANKKAKSYMYAASMLLKILIMNLKTVLCWFSHPVGPRDWTEVGHQTWWQALYLLSHLAGHEFKLLIKYLCFVLLSPKLNQWSDISATFLD